MLANIGWAAAVATGGKEAFVSIPGNSVYVVHIIGVLMVVIGVLLCCVPGCFVR